MCPKTGPVKEHSWLANPPTCRCAPLKTNSSPLKNDIWKTTLDIQTAAEKVFGPPKHIPKTYDWMFRAIFFSLR